MYEHSNLFRWTNHKSYFINTGKFFLRKNVEFFRGQSHLVKSGQVTFWKHYNLKAEHRLVCFDLLTDVFKHRSAQQINCKDAVLQKDVIWRTKSSCIGAVDVLFHANDLHSRYLQSFLILLSIEKDKQS